MESVMKSSFIWYFSVEFELKDQPKWITPIQTKSDTKHKRFDISIS